MKGDDSPLSCRQTRDRTKDPVLRLEGCGVGGYSLFDRTSEQFKITIIGEKNRLFTYVLRESIHR